MLYDMTLDARKGVAARVTSNPHLENPKESSRTADGSALVLICDCVDVMEC